ncbi:hypothetical protein ACLOAV_001154 [Pseudogymnoascus australis]
MRFSLTLVAAVAAVTSSVAAQDIAGIVSQIPSCALTCIATAAMGQSCEITNYKCQCEKMSAIQAAATPCVTTKCTQEDALKVLSLTGDLCKAVNGGSSSPSSSAAAGGDSPETTKAPGGGDGSAGGASPTGNGSVQPSIMPTDSATSDAPQPTGAYSEPAGPTETNGAAAGRTLL